MWIFTTAGFLSVSAHPENTGTALKISAPDKESLDALADGIELVAGGNRPDVFESDGVWYSIGILPEEFSAYMAHEIENFIDYPDFNFVRVVTESRGEHWGKSVGIIQHYIGELVDWQNADS